ncbi:hypothetical protein B0T14DRAFT_587972 [Immersiella caudata]|uniref:Uncharacterized protein n=1 Tax=Immersiella caudata TaxID=314043 RepID=A0AA40BWG3_9PEZI|nr:hypothetical protein B0T14DRAFT_587972 [Immersiella caudata]
MAPICATWALRSASSRWLMQMESIHHQIVACPIRVSSPLQSSVPPTTYTPPSSAAHDHDGARYATGGAGGTSSHLLYHSSELGRPHSQCPARYTVLDTSSFSSRCCMALASPQMATSLSPATVRSHPDYTERCSAHSASSFETGPREFSTVYSWISINRFHSRPSTAAASSPSSSSREPHRRPGRASQARVVIHSQNTCREPKCSTRAGSSRSCTTHARRMSGSVSHSRCQSVLSSSRT